MQKSGVIQNYAFDRGENNDSQISKNIRFFIPVKKSRHPKILLPIEIFSQELSPLEAVVTFLKQDKSFRYSEIAALLNRDIRTIWITHVNAKKKQEQLLIPLRSAIKIPVFILSDRKFSILEALVLYLVEIRNISLTNVSRITKKSTSTIWTVLYRAKKKTGVKNR